ncbi:DUF4247 domain-containing protein [Gordonia zhaorongruii]|uniref:DUF4247 domain-containing protein n=1 Tax=Gordonia zhaorongruii TaxID=2597659 RepID=UPI001053A718|nr:DUF4247 domain-containing protein [Gordonia zhaorongruii]
MTNFGTGGGHGEDHGDDRGEEPDRSRRWRTVRTVAIVVAIVIAVFALAVTCSSGNGDARNYVTSNYQRDASLDEGSVKAYVADGNPTKVADELSDEESPADRREGASGTGNVEGSRFLQYPDYLIALFPHAGDKTRVMLSTDYRSGYHHYHSYVGAFWVPTPAFSGSGSGYRGGGSGAGK